jgi:predicted heme/steroid binding protein/uncharacterized membrane protein
MKEWTPEELELFNGKEGAPIYIAFGGKVYDVTQSRLWSKGIHMNRHRPGKDLSGEMSAAPHGPEVLERFPQIGILKKEPLMELKHLPEFLQNILLTFPMARRHPHPMLVHFPIAFLMASSLFLLLYLLFPKPSFEVTAFYLLLLGSFSTPFAIATGLLTWWINYRLKLTHVLKRKIQLSIILLTIEIFLLLWRTFYPGVTHPLYYFLVFSLTPLVMLLGYYGGQMTFPTEK